MPRTMRGAGLAVAAAGVLGGAVFAGEQDDKIARLETLLESQQQRIENLQSQLATVQGQDNDSARVEMMRAQIREVLNEREFRDSLMSSTLQAGYDDGFFLRSSDDAFMLKVNGKMQFRYTYYETQSRNRYLLPRLEREDRSGFDLQRVRLGFSGHAWSQDWTYEFILSGDAPDGYNWRVYHAWVNYRLQDELQFKAGAFRIASTRAQAMSDGDFQFIDRPMTDAVFGLGRGVGLRMWGQLFDNQVEYFVDMVNALNDEVNNRTITADPAELDGNPAFTARVVWHAAGDPAVFQYEGDLDLLSEPALDIGMHYAFNEDRFDRSTTSIPFPSNRTFGGIIGGYGLTTTNGLQTNQFGFDAAFKMGGFSATSEYILRIVDVREPISGWALLTGSGSTVTQHGAYLQLGYFLPISGMEKQLELVGRVGGISTNGDGQEGTWEYSGGVNYYIQGNKVKLQTDIAKVYEAPISSSYSSLANVNDDAIVWRVQLQFAF